MDFGNWLELLLFWFLFVAYLVILFQILGDLFRDKGTNGWLKALWIIFLIVLPFLTALVYVIARGRGMAERTQRAAAQAKADTDEYIRSVAGGGSGGGGEVKSPAQQITEAKALLDQGVIDEAEFAQLKAKALG